ncbi:MAG: hypothetical protein AB8B91_22605 [Rubripirellula sp.]
MICRLFGLVLIVAWVSASSVADDVPPDAQSREDHSSEALRITTDAAKLYEFELVNQPPRKLEFHPTSVLRWSNPVAGEIYGNVFVWTHGGRPTVIGSIYQWYSPMTHGSHEFQSLATEPLEGKREGANVWSSQQSGIQWSPVPAQRVVADSKLTRTRQLREMARRFQVRKTDREDVSRELRLLAQPLFRYGSDDSNVIDGSLYAFVQGTDPEVFLLIEARKVSGGVEWQYALARMNSVKFVARYQEQEVWRKERSIWKDVKSGREPYTAFGPFRGEANQ